MDRCGGLPENFDEEMIDYGRKAGDKTGDSSWPMPYNKNQQPQMKNRDKPNEAKGLQIWTNVSQHNFSDSHSRGHWFETSMPHHHKRRQHGPSGVRAVFCFYATTPPNTPRGMRILLFLFFWGIFFCFFDVFFQPVYGCYF